MLDTVVGVLRQLTPQPFQSQDLLATRTYASNVFRPHALTAQDGRDEINADIIAHHGRAVTIATIGHGAAVTVDPGRFVECYHINVAMSGVLHSHIEGRSVQTGPGEAVLFDTHRRVWMDWGSDTVQLAIRIDSDALENKLAQALGHELTAPLRWQPTMNVAAGGGAAWVALVTGALTSYAGAPAGVRARLTADVENLILGQLLYTHPHSYWDELRGGHVTTLPRTVAKAREYALAHLSEPVSVGDLAAAAGVSVRSLQVAFQHDLGLTPMEFVRRERLSRVHADLTAGQGTVTDAAYRWGFTHLPRFAAAYRARYGCRPSTTLAGGASG